MIAKSEIAERLKATLAKELREDVNAITPRHTLRDDLGLNSLDAIELMFKIEEEFDLSIPDEDMQRLVTVGDVIAYIETKTQGGSLAAPAPAPTIPAPPKAVGPARTLSPAKSGPARKTSSKSKPVRRTVKATKPKGSRRHA